MNFTRIVKTDLDSPRRDIFSGGFAIVVTFTVFPAINVSCVSTAGRIPLYFERGAGTWTERNDTTINPLHMDYLKHNTEGVRRKRKKKKYAEDKNERNEENKQNKQSKQNNKKSDEDKRNSSASSVFFSL